MRDTVILQKIIMYCQRISDNLERYHHDFSAFENDYLFQDACCMCVVQIGELVSQLSDEAKRKNSAVPWRIIKDTRNFYVHAYGAIDIAAVCNRVSLPLIPSAAGGWANISGFPKRT